MKHKIFYAVGGFLLGNALLAGLFFGANTIIGNEKYREISLQEAVKKIDNEQVKEVNLKNSTAVLEDVGGNKFETVIASEPTREAVLTSVKEFNKTNPQKSIKYTETPANSGLYRLILINFLPYAMLGFSIIFIIAAFFMLRKDKTKLS